MAKNQEVQTEAVVDVDFSFVRVPKKTRTRGFWSMFVIMLGFTFFSASMSVGARMANGLDFTGFLLAVILGGAILAVYTGALGFIGSETGMSLDLLCQRSFGTKGSYLPSALISFTQIGWFGVGAAMFSIPVSEMLGINSWWLIIVIGIAMTASAYVGIKGIEIISMISVPLITILGTYSMFLALKEGGGFTAVFGQSTEGLSLFAAIAMVVGSFVSGGTATPNFSRFAKNNKIAVITTVIAFYIGNTLMFFFGGVAGAFTGQEDIFYVMIAQGLTIPAIIVLGANIWTTNDNALYTGGLGLANITKYKKRPMTIVAGIVGTVAALWLYDNFVGWLSVLNATLPPVGAIIVADFFMRKSAYKEEADKDLKKVNWFALAGVVAGALVGNFVTWGIAAINAMVVAVVIYAIGHFVQKNNRAAA